MPLNGAGVASKPAGTTAVSGAVVESAKFNSVIDDIYAIFNLARPVAYGGTGVGTAIAAYDAFNSRGANVASAATLNLDAATGPNLHITGTTTVTAVTLGEGKVRLAVADGIFQFTVGASLIVNDSASTNHTTEAGELLIFIGDAAGVVRVWAIRASSSPASTTDILTGTNPAKYGTADSVAALWEKGSDVASAGTVSLGEGGLFHITGTTTITDIDFATAKDGRRATLIFDGILTLTHNATTLKLPGGANITTAAGDRCVVVQDSSDNIIVESYTKADGTQVGGTAILASQSLSSTGNTFTGILAGAKVIHVSLDGASLSGSDHILVQLGTSGGIETSGYISGSALVGGTPETSTAGFIVRMGGAGDAAYGLMTLAHLGGNVWTASFSGKYAGAFMLNGAGRKAALAGVVDRVKIAATGSNTFDGGTAGVVCIG